VHPDRSRVVIPNRKIVGEILHNYGSVRQLGLTLEVAGGTNLEQALAAAPSVVERSAGVLREPTPRIGVTAVAATAVTRAVAPWVAVTDYVAAQGELYRALVEEFRAREIAVPVPMREVRLVTAA